MTRYVLLAIDDDAEARRLFEDTADAIVNGRPVELLTPVQENTVAFRICDVIREGHPDAIRKLVQRSYAMAQHYERQARAERWGAQ